MQDYIIRATAADGQIRAFVADTRILTQKAREIHNTSPVASAALGRALTAGAMMGLMLKGEKDLLTLQLKGDGPLKGIVVTADSKANVKGYVYEPNVDIPLKPSGKLDVGGAIGQGSLSILRDTGLKEPYIGKIPLISGEIADDLTYYFAKSEQIPTAVALGVLIDVDTSVKQAGGFIIQLMPNTQESVVEALEERMRNIPSVTQMLETGNSAEGILNTVLGDMGVNVLDKVPAQFYCNCSRQRVEKALISIGKKDLQEILNTDKKAELHCHFCNKSYTFEEEDLKRILEEINNK